uniref:Secreted protein n=1 Tax=Arundo donax TaxID=35708 RepID=A0A0A9DLW5_ARUDO
MPYIKVFSLKLFSGITLSAVATLACNAMAPGRVGTLSCSVLQTTLTANLILELVKSDSTSSIAISLLVSSSASTAATTSASLLSACNAIVSRVVTASCSRILLSTSTPNLMLILVTSDGASSIPIFLLVSSSVGFSIVSTTPSECRCASFSILLPFEADSRPTPLVSQ